MYAYSKSSIIDQNASRDTAAHSTARRAILGSKTSFEDTTGGCNIFGDNPNDVFTSFLSAGDYENAMPRRVQHTPVSTPAQDNTLEGVLGGNNGTRDPFELERESPLRYMVCRHADALEGALGGDNGTRTLL